MFNCCHVTLDRWVAANDAGPRQDSEEWLRERKKTIGGSEMATVQGANHFATVHDLIASKIGLTPRSFGVPMTWGKIMEPVICSWTEREFLCRIKAADMFVRGRFERQSYSPDGLGVVDAEYAGCDLTMTAPAIALFEFKCPFSRRIGADGTIPKQYLPQVLSGLDTINIADFGIFIEGMFRRCSIADMTTVSAYNTEATPRDAPGDSKKMLAAGYIVFYTPASGDQLLDRLTSLEPLRRMISELGTRDQDGQRIDVLRPAQMPGGASAFDIGAADVNAFAVFARAFDTRALQAEYSPLAYDGPKDYSGQIKSTIARLRANKNIVYAVMPYKLFRIGVTFVEPQPGYLDQWIPLINEIMAVVDRCRDDPENKKKIYIEYVQKHQERMSAADAIAVFEAENEL